MFSNTHAQDKDTLSTDCLTINYFLHKVPYLGVSRFPEVYHCLES